jgi:lysophospholipase L1-like esterase
VIFVSLGGNDQLEQKCVLEASTVENRITSALQKIEKACPTSKIYMVGYPTPRKDFVECAITTGKGTNDKLNAPVKAACEASSLCTYDAATDTGGGTDSTPSTGEFHVDRIHFNERGYCVLWNRDSFRTLMSCQGGKTDCSKVEARVDQEVQMEEGAMAGVALSAMALLATLAL